METELFLNLTREIIERNLSNVDFSANDLAAELGMSKFTLNRGLTKKLNVAFGEFVKIIQLKHARLMLLNDVDNVRYIACAVGFNNAKYFSRYSSSFRFA